jgi:hypothetical protein
MLPKPIQPVQPTNLRELFLIVQEVRKRAEQEHAREMQRIKNRGPSEYKYTKYVYDIREVPPGYVQLDKKMRSTDQMKKYARQVRRNTGGTLIVLPSIVKPFKTEFPEYIIFTPIPQGPLSLVVSTLGKPPFLGK